MKLSICLFSAILFPLAANAASQCTAFPAAKEISTSAVDVDANRMPASRLVAVPALPEGTIRPFTVDETEALPALAALGADGRALLRLGPPVDGVQGVFARKDDRYQVYYVLPGGKRLIRGELYDLDGTNETVALLRSVPGALPTVDLTGRKDPASTDHAAPLLLARGYGGSTGKTGAPHVWMAIDPFCGPSVTALRALTPLVDAGKLRLTLLPLSINDHEDKGNSTRAAQALLSLPPGEVVAGWNRIIDRWAHAQGAAEMEKLWSSDWQMVARGPQAPPATEAGANAPLHLNANMAIARDLEVKGTPTLFWLDRNGHIQRSQGLPADLDQMVQGAAP